MKRLRASFLAGAALLAAGLPALATDPLYQIDGYPAGSFALGRLQMCMNSAGRAVPCPLSDLQPATTPPFRSAQPEQRALIVTGSPNWTTGHQSTPALATSLIVKPMGGALLGFNCTAITGGAAGYCVAYNSATVPGTGALTGAQVLDTCYFDTTPRGCSLSRIPVGAFYNQGIVILITSAATPLTYTTGTDTGFISADAN